MVAVNKEKVARLAACLFLLLFLTSALWGLLACSNQNIDKHPDPSEFSRSLSSEIFYLNEEPKALINDEKKYGFVDETGQWIISPQYDYAQNFVDGYALVGMKEGYDPSLPQPNVYTYTLINVEGEDVLGEPVDERLRDAVYIFTQEKDIKKKYAEVMAFLTSQDSYQSLKYVGDNLYQVRVSKVASIYEIPEYTYIVDNNLKQITDHAGGSWDDAYFSGAAVKDGIDEAHTYRDPFVSSEGKSFGGLVCAYPHNYFSLGEVFAGDTHNSGGMMNLEGKWTIEPTYSYKKIIKYNEHNYLAFSGGRTFVLLGKGGEVVRQIPVAGDYARIYKTENST